MPAPQSNARQQGVLLGKETARRVLRLTGQKIGKRNPVSSGRRVEPGGHKIYQYVLTSNWSSGAATADIYYSDMAGDGDLYEEDANLYDPTRQNLMSDQETGDVGWCHRQNDGYYYAWQGPCTGSEGVAPTGATTGPEITEDIYAYSDTL